VPSGDCGRRSRGGRRETTNGPVTAYSAKEAKVILAEAKTARTTIPTEVVVDAGKTFTKAAQDNPDAWSTALAFVNYRSFLNKPPIGSWVATSSFDAIYTRALVVGGKRSGITPVEMVPIEQAAVLRQIGTFPNNPKEKYGNKFVVLHDGDVLLDNMELRHVIIVNARVVHTQGEVIMQDVYFVNCTFDLPHQPNMLNFASATLDKVAIDLTIS
jgi:hypothetical protein